MPPALRNVLFAVGLTVSAAACERCAPGQVATGVSRLTTQSLGMVVEILNDDDACGFESEAVKRNVQLSGPVGTLGTGTLRVENCVLERPQTNPYVSEACDGVQTRAWGRLRVTAERRIHGVIGGELDNPVIPSGPESVTVEIVEADFADFRVETSDSKNALTWNAGTIAGSVSPRLAVDNDLGACSVPTSHAYLANVRYGPGARVWVDTEDRSFGVDVGGSELFAVNGRHSGRENDLWGDIVVWGGTQAVPDDGDGLDPDYNAATFEASFECKDSAALPIRYDCEDFLGPVLAQNTARISMRLLGRITDALESNADCGFSSPDVLRNAVLEGEVGRLGAAVMRVDRCTLDFPDKTVITTDCHGVPSVVEGRVVVSATQRLEGRLTGDLETPVVPMTDNPAVFDMIVESLEEFEVDEAGTAVRVHEGRLSGRVEPRVAANSTDEGACSYVSDIVRFTDVRWEPSRITLRSEDGTFLASIQRSDLYAVNGYWASDENVLGGSIVLDEAPYDLPTSPADDGLNPDYGRTAFDTAWQCGTLETPVRFDCAFEKPVAEGIARLLILSAGTIASTINSDDACGFDDFWTSIQPDLVEGEHGEIGRLGWTIDSCEIRGSDTVPNFESCSGSRTFLTGRTVIAAKRTVSGRRQSDFLIFDSIVPNRPNSVVIELLQAQVENLHIFDVRPGESEAFRGFQIPRGSFSAIVEPILAENADTRGVFDIATPVARFEAVQMRDTEVVVFTEGRTFRAYVNRADLEAFNGSYEGLGLTNMLRGEIVVDGKPFALDIPLDPSFEQGAFDASYACTEDLFALIPPQSGGRKR